ERRTQMVGKLWARECMDSDLLQTAIKEKFMFETDTFERRILMFEGTECENSAGMITITGDYKLSMQEGETEMANLDLTANKITISVENEIAVRILDAISFCGHEEWTVGEDVVLESVEGENCFFTELPATHFGRVEVNSEEQR